MTRLIAHNSNLVGLSDLSAVFHCRLKPLSRLTAKLVIYLRVDGSYETDCLNHLQIVDRRVHDKWFNYFVAVVAFTQTVYIIYK